MSNSDVYIMYGNAGVHKTEELTKAVKRTVAESPLADEIEWFTEDYGFLWEGVRFKDQAKADHGGIIHVYSDDCPTEVYGQPDSEWMKLVLAVLDTIRQHAARVGEEYDARDDEYIFRDGKMQVIEYGDNLDRIDFSDYPELNPYS